MGNVSTGSDGTGPAVTGTVVRRSESAVLLTDLLAGLALSLLVLVLVVIHF